MAPTDRDAAFAALVADATVTRIVERVTDPDFAEKAIDTYSASIQRAVGRAVIKTGLWILFAFLLWGGWKLGVIQKMLP